MQNHQNSVKPSVKTRPLGLYIHVPFCSFLCHYCDFVKTARWDQELIRQYFESLTAQFSAWQKVLPKEQFSFSSVYIGGGTPGLFSHEYKGIFTDLLARLTPAAEFTLEANPNNMTREALECWSSMGVNRLSVGVQSFQPHVLDFLKRDHSPRKAADAIQLARTYIPNVSLDLIYGSPCQQAYDWELDLEKALELGVEHLSLYSLTYAKSTPIGRAYERKRLNPMPVEQELRLYEHAVARLDSAGFEQYEVSNWALPGRRSVHNQLYWQNHHYLALGPGSHGFLPAREAWGVRYHYNRSIQENLRIRMPDFPLEDPPTISVCLEQSGANIQARNKQEWLFEYIASATRTQEGLDLERIGQNGSFYFSPTPLVIDAIGKGDIRVTEEKRLQLAKKEWIRENAWCLELMSCFESIDQEK